MLYRPHETAGRHVMSYTEASDDDLLADPDVQALIREAVERERVRGQHMTPTPDLTRRLLALPIENRRALVEAGKDAPGWWVGGDGLAQVQRAPMIPGLTAHFDPEPRIDRGEAWFPCDSRIWLDATGLEWALERGDNYGLRASLYLPPSGDILDADTAPEAALAYWEWRNRQPTDSESTGPRCSCGAALKPSSVSPKTWMVCSRTPNTCKAVSVLDLSTDSQPTAR